MTATSQTHESVRFVVLAHDWPMLHWDLLIEAGDACRTWRLLACPDHLPVPCDAIADHRPHYLTYEGPVFGDRGTVTRWTAGTATRLGVDRFQLVSDRLSGTYRIADGLFAEDS